MIHCVGIGFRTMEFLLQFFLGNFCYFVPTDISLGWRQHVAPTQDNSVKRFPCGVGVVVVAVGNNGIYSSFLLCHMIMNH